MQWLSVAIGDHCSDLELALRHTRRGLTLCPLQGGGYLHMAELCFLEGRGQSDKDAYITQAIKVRPFDGAVLFEAGREAWLSGNGSAAIDFWQQATRYDRKQQKRLVAVLAGRVPVDFILENFPPDLEGLRAMHSCYRRLDQPDQLEQVRRRYSEAARAEAEQLDGQAAANRWLEAQSIYSLLGDERSAAQALRSAFRLAPNDFGVRWRLARCLIRQQRYAEARRHLDWCQQRRPEFAGLKKRMKEVVKKQIEIESRTVGARKPAATHR
jgi:tetratricopeptide (TPR) repeat protein